MHGTAASRYALAYRNHFRNPKWTEMERAMSQYMSPTGVCDLVMKGGITSGVLYPPAIDEIAQRFWLSGIGGTSAGAIAAALAAAAELSRRNGSSDGYTKLKSVPDEISGNGRLLQLFKPDHTTKRAFRLLTRSLELKERGASFVKPRLIARALWLMSTQSPIRRVAANGLGLCTGMGQGMPRANGDLPPLTEWLSAKLDELAGKKAETTPLTFGDLWNAPPPSNPGFAEKMTGTTGIYLQLVSTCLTFGRPYTLPYLDNRFAFNPADFRKLFPEYVVRYMEEEGKKILAATRVTPPQGLLPLPTGARLPVIVAVRMSLSFPVLFSTVPLHYVNFRNDPPIHEEVYFADGGITSNLPVYFFDSPFPRWPTLAINLQYTPQTGEYGRSNVDANHLWMTTKNTDGTLELFNRFLSPTTPIRKMLGLGGAIFRSAQVWSDNSFLKLPGYRDRVAEVWLDPHEGGMNLNMKKEVIDDLVKYGRAAGAKLVKRFADTPGTDPLSWNGHRWARYRAGMAALTLYLRRWERAVSNSLPNDRELRSMLQSVDQAPSYRFSSQKRLADAAAATEKLIELIKELDTYQPAQEPGQDDFRPFDGGPQSPLVLQGRYSMTPLTARHAEPPANPD